MSQTYSSIFRAAGLNQHAWFFRTFRNLGMSMGETSATSNSTWICEFVIEPLSLGQHISHNQEEVCIKHSPSRASTYGMIYQGRSDQSRV